MSLTGRASSGWFYQIIAIVLIFEKLKLWIAGDSWRSPHPQEIEIFCGLVNMATLLHHIYMKEHYVPENYTTIILLVRTLGLDSKKLY
ncbi:hypothetical protein [[Limnothrix rosea] IAM M-220]|uniref:hypothetical protein n=1 Tax=[Limnothrix rosea] IAM M-220 TaxID=454133 RepID=UPI000966CFAE|nr:hypothetical protein [[Limnothrix rosea] IAM M-220]OKH19364.1 hypothetical protein NIES208_02280 [[Limnothrix rosea] IAM M-220]